MPLSFNTVIAAQDMSGTYTIVRKFQTDDTADINQDAVHNNIISQLTSPTSQEMIFWDGNDSPIALDASDFMGTRDNEKNINFYQFDKDRLFWVQTEIQNYPNHTYVKRGNEAYCWNGRVRIFTAGANNSFIMFNYVHPDDRQKYVDYITNIMTRGGTIHAWGDTYRRKLTVFVRPGMIKGWSINFIRVNF